MAKFIQSLITVITYMKWNLINIMYIYYCPGGKEKIHCGLKSLERCS